MKLYFILAKRTCHYYLHGHTLTVNQTKPTLQIKNTKPWVLQLNLHIVQVTFDYETIIITTTTIVTTKYATTKKKTKIKKENIKSSLSL